MGMIGRVRRRLDATMAPRSSVSRALRPDVPQSIPRNIAPIVAGAPRLHKGRRAPRADVVERPLDPLENGREVLAIADRLARGTWVAEIRILQ